MEFNEKLKELRAKRGLTQEELAEILYVSRTAVSKWESGRGYPSIDSLKLISEYFNVSVDELLSSKELLVAAEHDSKQRIIAFKNVIFSIIDCLALMFLFLPFLSVQVDDMATSVSLLNYGNAMWYIKASYIGFVSLATIYGVLVLVIRRKNLIKNKQIISLIISSIGCFIFILTRQPYAASFVFVLLLIKIFLVIKS